MHALAIVCDLFEVCDCLVLQCTMSLLLFCVRVCIRARAQNRFQLRLLTGILWFLTKYYPYLRGIKENS